MTVVPNDEHEAAGSAAAGDEHASSAAAADPTGTAGTVDEYIGSRLRQAFDAVAQQPVPDRFLELIAALDKR